MRIYKFIALFLILFGTLFADQLETITSNGLLKAGVKNDFEPFGFFNSKNELVGFDIDIAKFIAKELNVKIEFVPVTSANRMEQLIENNIWSGNNNFISL